MEIAPKEDKITIWERHMRSWAVSRTTQKAYCKQHALSYHSFKFWKKSLMHKKLSAPLKIVQVAESKGLFPKINSSRQAASAPIRFWVGEFRSRLQIISILKSCPG